MIKKEYAWHAPQPQAQVHNQALQNSHHLRKHCSMQYLKDNAGSLMPKFITDPGNIQATRMNIEPLQEVKGTEVRAKVKREPIKKWNAT